jgi:hypothetical protein
MRHMADALASKWRVAHQLTYEHHPGDNLFCCLLGLKTASLGRVFCDLVLLLSSLEPENNNNNYPTKPINRVLLVSVADGFGMDAVPERDLRRLAKRYRIAFKPPLASSDWPPVHKATFESILKIGNSKFDTFSASIDIRSSEEPWREKVKYRAEWLAARAARLFSQQRNEPGWRFGLENDVLQRFSVEVAW